MNRKNILNVEYRVIFQVFDTIVNYSDKTNLKLYDVSNENSHKTNVCRICHLDVINRALKSLKTPITV